jgi:iron complex transport system ATP-binding protein
VVIEFAGVTVIRDGKPILDDVDWTVAEGQRWVLLGPNGAGKTTLLAIAATLMHPTHGVASILEELLGLTDVFELRPRIGVASSALAQAIPGDELALDVVRTGAYAMLGTWHEEYAELDNARAMALLEMWGAARLARRSFGTLSEGERKRVQIARALMADPEILLLDEPAAGLDLGGREDLVTRLGALARSPEAPTLVLVTHHVEEIPVGITHAMLLREGRVVSAGPIAHALTSEHLSSAFGLPLELVRRDAGDGTRYSAHLAATAPSP